MQPFSSRISRICRMSCAQRVKEGTDYITITLYGVVYKGVLMEMTDEAENPVFCFSAAGDNEETLWGVQYIQKE